MLPDEALAQLRAGRPRVAAKLLEQHLASDAGEARSWFLLGACRHAAGDLDDAAAALAQSIALEPANREAHLALVSVLRQTRKPLDALHAAQQAAARFSDDASITYATALCFDDLGRSGEALGLYDRVLDLFPSHEDALHNRGLILVRLGRLAEAEGSQRRYVGAFPGSTRARSGLIDILLAAGQFDEALKESDGLESSAPKDVSNNLRRGVALACLRRFGDARRVFTAAQKADPAAVARYLQRIAPGADLHFMLSPENIYLESCRRAIDQCDWRCWGGFVSEMQRAAREANSTLEPMVAFMSRLVPLSGAERHAIARSVARRIEDGVAALKPLPPTRHRRVRIGILSSDFREHLNAYLLLPLFELLDRSRFELYAYSLATNDGSNVRKRIEAASDHFRDLHSHSDIDAAMTIRNDDIDILLDVGGFTHESRFAITARRPARLQVNYLGFSSSLGSTRIDYAIVDRACGGDPSEWTERLAFLPHTHFLYDFRDSPPSVSLRRREYGLPDDAFVYCAFHRTEKISPDVFDLWMKIAARVPRAIVWFRGLSDAAQRNLCAEAAKRGVDPKRLAFAPFEPSQDPRYLARHRLGDVMLDSLHHNAMTSACDALGVGLPVLTMPGTALASRAGASLVGAADLPELIASSPADYVEKAVWLANDASAMRGLKERLTENRSKAPLFDTAGRVRALEAAFLGMYERMARGEPPASFDV